MPFSGPLLGASQSHLDIEDIREDIVILKDGSCCLILQTTAINFGLLSEKEQDATIYAYAGLLNSLSFPMQIVIRSKRMDVSFYLDQLIQQENRQPNPAFREQIKKYRKFIESLIKENNVLDKKFYVVIPFHVTELGVKSATGALFGKRSLPFPKEHIIERAKTSLVPKRDHLIRQFTRIGLKVEQLTTQRLIELFYYLYNPTETGGLRLSKEVHEYTTPLVQPAVEPRHTAPPLTPSQGIEQSNGDQPIEEETRPAWQRIAVASVAPTETPKSAVTQKTETATSQPKKKPEPTFRAILEKKMKGEEAQSTGSQGT
ncbi:MAG TPA: hypothetical protein VJ179_01715 [Patescibacteria group bacterium]|nr:hypothetical protein [Patescibacteria group bacterium]